MEESIKLDDLYKSYPNKTKLWILMRYVSVMIDVFYNIPIELHEPRKSVEFFTYLSDKYWSKLLYGLSNTNISSLEKVHEQIHFGARNNLIKYWYSILRSTRKIENTYIDFEIKYYLYSLKAIKDLKISRVFNQSEEKRYFDKLFNEDILIAELVYDLKNDNIITSIITEKLLNKLIYRTDEYIINEFNKYLLSPPTTICKEAEYKNEISELINDYK
jgi:hypothetical protein